MSPGSSTESYPAFARIGLRENPGKNLNQVTCPDRDSNTGHLVSPPDALTVTPQIVNITWLGYIYVYMSFSIYHNQKSQGIISGERAGHYIVPPLPIHLRRYVLLRHCNYHLYADDLQCYISSRLDRINDAIDKLNEDIDSIVTWTKKFHLNINPGKTQAIILGKKRQTDAVKHLDISPVKSERGGISIDTERTEIQTTSKLTVAAVTYVDSGNYTCRPADAKPAAVMLIVLEERRDVTSAIYIVNLSTAQHQTEQNGH
ncbi:hypothetical protein ANN_03154 [Periplaneta americana]|uniref:Ig-like domain-containing protein n=1 Tax=Periplaneta americana TaxID=6978 RepID=A0ABQ8U247_PERAM|nr:hypothetical protein ANN_03154 [Periplaneta americana]